MAERLTMTSDKGGVALTFDLEFTCRPSEAQKILKLAEKLKYYEDLEEHGRLIELPCKPFEKVWVAHLKFPTHQTMFCCNTHILETMEARYVIGYTKEEAEAKLKERGEQE